MCGLRVRLRVFVSGSESSLVVCRVQTCWARLHGWRPTEKCSVCVRWCAEVRSLPAHQIKSGWFPADDVDKQSAVSAAGLVSLTS